MSLVDTRCRYTKELLVLRDLRPAVDDYVVMDVELVVHVHNADLDVSVLWFEGAARHALYHVGLGLRHNHLGVQARVHLWP